MMKVERTISFTMKYSISSVTLSAVPATYQFQTFYRLPILNEYSFLTSMFHPHANYTRIYVSLDTLHIIKLQGRMIWRPWELIESTLIEGIQCRAIHLSKSEITNLRAPNQKEGLTRLLGYLSVLLGRSIIQGCSLRIKSARFRLRRWCHLH